jgi:hypothetical protein
MVPGLAKFRSEERLQRMDLSSLEYRQQVRADAIKTFKNLHENYSLDVASYVTIQRE